MTPSVIDNPILNAPYNPPSRHWRQDGAGHLVSEIEENRRPSESWVPVPRSRKAASAMDRFAVQGELDITTTGERRDVNQKINLLRQDVGAWRASRYPGVTPTTRRLLEHWADPDRENRVFFAQREAIETTIYVTEVAGRLTAAETASRDLARRSGWIQDELAKENEEYNAGLPRMALKMATGTGKTVVMAMLIAWQTLNKAAHRNDSRFTNRFLVVTPGVTVRDRLRVLHPSDEGNYYRERDLVPADLWPHLSQARITITNYHSFMPRTRHDGQGVSATTKKILSARTGRDPFLETDGQIVARVLRDIGGGTAKGGQIMVLNDEAHHCYLPRDPDAEVKKLEAAARSAAKEANAEAGVWFTGLQKVHEAVGIKQILDVSATPYFIGGSGYAEGFIFPWVVSDFSLMDAIESGLVKIPRLPVSDNAEGLDVAYLNLWNQVGDALPKRVVRTGFDTSRGLPAVLDGALRSLYSSYERSYRRWEETGAVGAPPVFIVVCSNTTVSKWVYDHVAGFEYTVTDDEGNEQVRTKPGMLDLFSNYDDGHRLAVPRTILVDSAELESGEAISKAFRDVAADEIETFRREYAARTGAAVGEIDDGQLLREVLNTVGKPGRLGGQVRCVVSVSMLSEGWDANTVTHVLGVRAFGSQLLCEQVVGRGLRRRSYVVDDNGLLPPEYAEVYGIPFALLPSDRPVSDPPPRPPTTTVRAVEGREAARIEFPRVDGYRFELPDGRMHLDLESMPEYNVSLGQLASETEVEGVIGSSEIHTLDDLRSKRPNEVAFKLAVETLLPLYADAQRVPKPWLVPELVTGARSWLQQKVRYDRDAFPGLLLIQLNAVQAAEEISRHLQWVGSHEPFVRAIIRSDQPTGRTDGVNFQTTKQTHVTNERSHISHVVLDSGGLSGGNTWEQIAALELERHDDVEAYVKNDHLEFAIPYTFEGMARRYRPDFLVRLARRPGDVERHLILEISGGQKDQRERHAKAETARNLWCAAVNNDGRFGRWGYAEVGDPVHTRAVLTEAIAAVYEDRPIIGVARDPFDHELETMLRFDDEPVLPGRNA